jgi:hypothetical protein
VFGTSSTVDKATINNASNLVVTDNSTLNLGSTVNNTGTLSLASAGNNVFLIIDSNGATLQGKGAVTLNDHSNDFILGLAAADVLTNVDNTISGGGQLGDGQLTLVNQAAGLIEGGATTNALTLDTGSGSFSNAGTIESTGGKGLLILNSTGTNTGTIQAVGSSGALSMQSSNITGGTFATSGGGTITTVFGTSTTVDKATINNASNLVIADNSTLNLSATVNNTGTVSLNSAGNNTVLNVDANGVTLQGGGTVALTDHSNNIIIGTASGGTSFSDTFSPPSSQWRNSIGNWTASGGDYFAQSPNNNPPTYTALPYDLSNTNLSLTVTVNALADGGIWLDTDGTNKNGVPLVLGGGSYGEGQRGGAAGNSAYWDVATNGSFSNPLDEVSGVFTPGNTYTITVIVNGNTYTAYNDPDGHFDQNSTVLTTLVDNTYSHGEVGLYDNQPGPGGSGTPTSFSNFSVSNSGVAPLTNLKTPSRALASSATDSCRSSTTRPASSTAALRAIRSLSTPAHRACSAMRARSRQPAPGGSISSTAPGSIPAPSRA